MDIAFLLDKYFKGADKVSIDVFDAQTLNTVYKDVITAMTSHFEIEVSVLQALSYCLYEMMDNVHIHSGSLWSKTVFGRAPSSLWSSARVKKLIQDSTTFKGLNPLAERSVLVALQRRYKVVISEKR